MIARQNNGQEKTAWGCGSFSAVINQHKAYSATNRDAEKCFSTWQARYAIYGHTLYRTASSDGAILYLASRWGLIRELKSLEAVASFFGMIGGKL